MKKIDIGCGPRPQPNYDAYIDIYMHDNVAKDPYIKERFVKTGAEDLSMFKDKEFDFAFCHHVIEHVQDPNRACAEMIRVAKEGILYFPSVQADILFGRSDHRWLIFQDKPNHLLFIRKRFNSYYAPKTVPKEGRAHSPLNQTPFKWKGSFEWTVVL